MDWDAIDLNAANNNIGIESQAPSTLQKVANYGVTKDNRERKKVAQGGKSL